MKKVVVNGRQSLKDLALKYYGNLEGMARLIELNPTFSFNTILTAGDVLFVSTEPIVDRSAKAVVELYKSNNYTPATGSDLFVPPNPFIFDRTFGTMFN